MDRSLKVEHTLRELHWNPGSAIATRWTACKTQHSPVYTPITTSQKPNTKPQEESAHGLKMVIKVVAFSTYSYGRVSAKWCQSCPSSRQPYGLSLTKLLCPCDSPGKNTGMGCHILLQGLFPTQGSNPRL